jgi:hypothetical protein
MSDEIDIANERADIERANLIATIRNKSQTITPTGCCLECDAPVAEGLRWCDNHCRDDWQRWNPEA